MIGQRFEKANDLSEALKFYEKALKLNPRYAQALNGVRRVMERMGNASPAETTAQ